MQVRHALLATNLLRRMHFVEWFIQRCQRKNFLQNIIIGNEAAFSMNGEVNTENARQYAPKGHPPAFNFEQHVSRAKLTVWATLCGNGVLLGPYFFRENVNGQAYLSMLNEFVFRYLLRILKTSIGVDVPRSLVGSRRGAPAHRLITVRDRLNAVFGSNRIIGLGHDVEWPPRSPDLTPYDFFMWGYLKDRVFSTGPPQNIDHLRRRISNEFDALRRQPEFIRRAVRDMHKRAILCVERNEGHVEGHSP